MARLRYNDLRAALGGSLTSSATSVTFAAALTHSNGTAVPTISGSDYVPLTILDGSGNLSEIVYLTAYTSGGTTGTIARGQESTTGVSHASGDKIVQAATVVDLPVSRFKTADEAVTSSTTPQDDDHLVFPIGSNEIWVVTYSLYVSAGSATPDLKVGPVAPAGATLRWGGLGADPAATSTLSQLKNQSHTSASLVFGVPAVATTTTTVHFTACIENGSTAGNVTLQWSQNASDANAVTLLRGSFLFAHRVA